MKNKEQEIQMCREVGKRLCELRKMNNLTQNQAADYLGVSQSNMSQLETDTRKFSVYSIKKLLELYNASYESVLGELSHDNTENLIKPECAIESVNLLMSVCEQAESQDLNNAVCAYINMCVYVIMRELYEANPRNTGKIFSIEKDAAHEFAIEFIEKSPHQISSFIKASTGKVNKKSIEPPLEKAADFREFIRNSEEYISKYLIK